MLYYVSKNGNDENTGTIKNPFLTISKATEVVKPGDCVIVREGTYRECVNPLCGGTDNKNRITFKAYDNEKVIIKGSEEINNWQKYKNIWFAKVPNSIFGDENPFDTELYGDWLDVMDTPFLHTGAVYIDGEALCEKLYKKDVFDAPASYYAETDKEYTTIYANFDDKYPDEALTEVNVRKSCFMPLISGINYITVSGFEFSQCATNWAPPTAEQTGAVWARWCKGWIIENNIIHHSKCSGISLGIDKSFGHNEASVFKKKPGFHTQLEIVFKALKNGWAKENIGSHIVRNNIICDCGQTGIVGHMGGAFSEIYGNHIYNIGIKREFTGAELAGIKLHAAIDTYIHNNAIHDCVRGIWLDWQAQGTRVCNNIFYNNDIRDDLFIEVSHGPTFVYNNIMNSSKSLTMQSQGVAAIHNWFGGKITHIAVGEGIRYTPYHLPHSTDVMGVSAIYTADDHFYQNVFILNGTEFYNDCPTSENEYVENARRESNTLMAPTYLAHIKQKQPAYINKNVYTKNAQPFNKEQTFKILEAELKINEEADGIYAKCIMPENTLPTEIINSHDLAAPRISNELYEDSNGNPVIIDSDICGEKRNTHPTPGPIENLSKKVCVFKKWM